MRTRAALGSIFGSIAVLVIGWQAGGAALSVQGPTITTGSSAGSAAGSTAGSTAATPATTSTGTSSGTYTGDSVGTRYGDVQVAVTVSGGQITDVTAVRLTDHDRRSVQLSNRAAPILQKEVLASQSANVSNVSGATYTSDAYLQSVQSALDQAGL